MRLSHSVALCMIYRICEVKKTHLSCHCDRMQTPKNDKLLLSFKKLQQSVPLRYTEHTLSLFDIHEMYRQPYTRRLGAKDKILFELVDETQQPTHTAIQVIKEIKQVSFFLILLFSYSSKGCAIGVWMCELVLVLGGQGAP